MAKQPTLVRAEDLRYSNEHNDALRYALYARWKQRCHHCDKWLAGARDTQIDHLLPQDLDNDPQAKKEALAYVGLEEPFDLDSVENLAPIHPGCNGSDAKGSANLAKSGYLVERIVKSTNRAADVRDLAVKILNAHGLNQAIATVDSYEHFKRHGARDTYAEAARVMLQALQDRVPNLFDEIVVEKQNFRFSLEEVVSEIDVPTEVGVGLGLRVSDQAILKLIESVCGVSREDLLDGVLRRCLEVTREAAGLAAAAAVASNSTPGDPVFDHFDIEIESISHSGDCSDPVELRVTAEGRASVFVAPGSYSSAEHIQKDVEIRTPVDVRIFFPSMIGGDVAIEADIVPYACETAVDKPLTDWDQYYAEWEDEAEVKPTRRGTRAGK